MTNLRIHGDNIVECKRALTLLGEALSPQSEPTPHLKNSAVTPIYQINNGQKE